MISDSVVKVFVVDDERIIVSTLVLILNLSGFSTSGFYGAKEALAAAVANGPPHLLITDVSMPGMNGIELALRFEKEYPDCKVLLFSGNASTSELLAVALREGHAFQILTKPVHPKDLIAAAEKMTQVA